MQEPQVTAPEAEAGSPPAAPEPFTAPAPQDAAPEAPSAPDAEASPETPPEHNWDEVWEHEELKTRRETVRESAHGEGRLQGLQEATAASDESMQSFDKLTRQVGAVLGRLNKAASDGALDAAGVSQLLSEHQETFFVLNKALDKEFQGQYGHVGYSELLKEMGEGLENPSLLADFEKRLPLAARRIDKRLASDLRKWLTSKVETDAYERGRKKGLADAKAAQAAAQQVKGAKGTGPNLAPGSPAGGRSDAELLKDPTTSIEKLMEIRARQKAAGE